VPLYDSTAAAARRTAQRTDASSSQSNAFTIRTEITMAAGATIATAPETPPRPRSKSSFPTLHQARGARSEAAPCRWRTAGLKNAVDPEQPRFTDKGTAREGSYGRLRDPTPRNPVASRPPKEEEGKTTRGLVPGGRHGPTRDGKSGERTNIERPGNNPVGDRAPAARRPSAAPSVSRRKTNRTDCRALARRRPGSLACAVGPPGDSGAANAALARASADRSGPQHRLAQFSGRYARCSASRAIEEERRHVVIYCERCSRQDVRLGGAKHHARRRAICRLFSRLRSRAASELRFDPPLPQCLRAAPGDLPRRGSRRDEPAGQPIDGFCWPRARLGGSTSM